MVEPQVVKGFRDFLPLVEQKRQQFIGRVAKVFSTHSYLPIDTPAIEYAKTLLDKSGGETEKQIFRFTDNGGRDVALRFDLTVPFARYIAMHKDAIGLPFRRYHIAKVWRGEKPQKGRYREFIQCDFDIVGSDAVQSDIDVLLTAYHIFNELAVTNIVIEINHRALFNRFLTQEKIEQYSIDLLQSVDKLSKIGSEAVLLLIEPLIGSDKAAKLLSFIKQEESFSKTLKKTYQMVGACEELDRLQFIEQILTGLGIINFFSYNPSITRGLDYYTGLVFETFLTDLPSIGSICSGGRYDNLVGLYSNEAISGIGGSVGLDRLMAALDELKLNVAKEEQLKIIVFDSDYPLEANKAALLLRQEGFSVEIYPNKRKLETQFKYADRIGATFGIIVENNSYTLRSMIDRSLQEKLDLVSLLSYIRVK